jgi:CII-binding regulator of phage lambda lysogenization HflD
MADIDSLQIKIKADATSASNALNKLANSLTNFQRSLSIDTSKLTSISNSIQSIANAANSMNTSGIKNISTLTNSINRMGKIDTSGLSKISSALKTFSADMAGTKVDGVGDITSIASSISKLGGVASGRAITNIPLLAKNLKQLFTTLSTTPNVSENIIRMTNALAGLASTGAASGRAANSLGRNLNTYTASAKRATKSTFSLAAAFGKFYATYFLVIRGIKSLWKSIEGTTDYIEAFNYYTVAFNKVGKEWGKDFEKFGYDNAEDYAQSFGNRVNELLGKMSGLKVDVDGGLISESGMKNLGLNLQEITQYASQLASITNSLGQTGEVTTAISKSMTMLAGDISSLFNVDFSTVATNLQSGLIGQSRALYKYGIDITNATLQTYAYKYGIEKAVSEMSQAEKQQLRLLAILDQSKVSWGDLANTINSPSNMIRQFTNNVKEAGMVLGQLFIPVLQKVLPVINGVVIAIKRLLVSVANLMGIKIDFDSFGKGVSGYNEELEDTADTLDKVGKSAKNAQSGIRAFDKLKVISTPKSSGSGSSAGGAGIDLTKEIMDATSEYEKVWQEAFDKMQNTAMEWADKIEKLLEPVKKLFKDLFNGDFFEAGQDLSGIVTGIFNWMSDAIASVDWYQIGQNIGQFLAGIDWTAVFTSAGNFIKTAIDAAIDLWKGSFDAAPIETTILTAIGLLKFTGVGDIIWGKISDKLSAKVLGSSIGIVPTIAIAAVTWEIGFNVGKSLGKALFPEDAEYYDNFTWFGENGFFDTLKNTDFTTLKTAWDDLYKDITDNDLYRFLTGTMLLPKHSTIDDFGDKIDWLIDKIKNTKVDMSDTFGLSSALINIAPLVGNWFNENVSPWFTKEKWQGMGQTINSSLSEKWTSFTTWWSQTGFSNWWKKISEQFGLTKWNKLLENIPTAFRTAFKTAANVAIAPLNLVISGIETMINNAIDLINGLISAARLIPKIGDAVPNNIQHINVGRIPTFETGGYVPSRYTMFMAGENGVPEIAGTVGGKTAVAGGVEITGIKDAINSTAQQEIALLKQNNQLLQEILEKEFGITTDQIGIAARQYGQEQFNQKHKNVYVF